MEQPINQTAPAERQRRVWLPILIVIGAALLVLAALIAGVRAFSRNSSLDAPTLVAAQSRYEMYELRNDTVLLTYAVTLRNDTGRDLRDFAMRAVLQTDYKNGYITDPAATVRQWGKNGTVFSLAAGETKTFDVILTAPYQKYNNTQSASGELPQLYAVYPDGSEGKIETE